MHLYSLTLQKATAIQKSIYGNFSSSKAQEILVSKGKYLELIRPDDQTGKLQVVLTQEVFGIIRSLAAFRLTGSNRDYIIVGSDSGRVVILQYDSVKNSFDKVHQETFGKTGCRRIVPGQFLACDPKGRAFMIGALEKQKFVYILNRDAQSKLTISSPLEAHKSHNLVYDIIGIDVGYENPLFAVLEADYGDIDQNDSPIHTGAVEKFLIYYEMDLGLNHVIRKNAESIPQSAHMLIPVPGAPDGPGGLFICCENYIIYKGLNGSHCEAPYPYRKGSPTDRGIFINCYGSHKQKDMFFFLLQSELGDIFKLNISFTHEEVHGIQLQYFDTIPVSNSLVVLKTGYLFNSCEFGNHQLYNFISIGDEESDPVTTDSTMNQDKLVEFYPRELKNLALTCEIDNLASITDVKVEDLKNEGNPQIYTLCAAGNRSNLRILRHGLAIIEMAVSPLPGKPQAVWTIKSKITDQFHQFIILSFLNQTLVLQIGEKVVEINDSGLEAQKPTIHVNLMEDNAIIQVIPNGIRHIRRDKRINQWLTEGKIVKASSNPRQLVIALEGGELIYFELDSLGQLSEIEKITLDCEVMSLDIGSIPEDMQRCKFLAVGLSDCTVKLLSLDPETCLQRFGTQVVPAYPESICLMEMSPDTKEENVNSELYLQVGLSNGNLLRTAVDFVTGNLSDTRTRFLGSKGVKLFKVQVNNKPAMLALSSRPWICYTFTSQYFTVPLSYESIDFAAGFCSQECTEGIVGISNNTLRIFAPERLGDIFNHTVVQLRYSPRKMIVDDENKNLIIIETSHREYNQAEYQEYKKEYYGDNQEAMEVSELQIGTIKAPVGTWGSCLRIYSPKQNDTIQLYDYPNNEAAFSISLMTFTSFEGQNFVVVGVVQDLYIDPKSFTSCFIDTYLVNSKGKLELFHRTPVEDQPYCFASYKGKLLAGVGNTLKLMELGKKKLLIKSEMRGFQSGVTNIQVIGERIFLTDLSDSFHVVKYKQKEQVFFEVADDVLPRWISSVCILDYHTICGADKYENFFVCRLPSNLDDDLNNDALTYKNAWETGFLNGAPYKFTQICNMYVGEIISCMKKCSLVTSSNEVVLFGTSMGALGAFYPFETKEDVDFFLHLEMYLRIEATPLCGRDHIGFRSSFAPIKSIVDGDLCEEYSRQIYSKQKMISEDLDRTPTEVVKKLEDIRNRIL